MAKHRTLGDPMHALRGATGIGADPMARDQWARAELPLTPGSLTGFASLLKRVRGSPHPSPEATRPTIPRVQFENFIEQMMDGTPDMQEIRRILRLIPKK